MDDRKAIDLLVMTTRLAGIKVTRHPNWPHILYLKRMSGRIEGLNIRDSSNYHALLTEVRKMLPGVKFPKIKLDRY